MVDTWYNEKIGNKVVEALKKNNFDAIYFADKEEAVEYALGFVKEGMQVAFGGSMTLKELGLPKRVEEKGAYTLNHNAPGLSAEEKTDIRRQQLLSDVFFSSTNALTLDGYLVNVDGVGNRVAAMSFGPKKVVVITGINKITRDIESALDRVKLIAAPKNTKRLEKPNPCGKTGICMDCQGETRICNIYTVMKKKPTASDITVIIVGEILGY